MIEQTLLYCLDATPNLFGVFDTTIAPSLLYYSYLPVIILMFLFGLIVYRNRTLAQPLPNILFFALSVIFSVFLLNEIVQWIAVPTAWVHLAWELSPLLQALMMIVLMYFVSVFVNQKDISYARKVFFALLLVPVLFFLPTKLNMISFDLSNCLSNIGPLFYYVYVLQGLTAFFIAVTCLKKYFSSQDRLEKNKILYLMIGAVTFVLVFSVSDILGELTRVYEINLIGPIGMLTLVGFLTYIIVKYQAFNVKVLSAQALVWGLIFFIGAQFFFIRNPVNYFLNGFTFIVTLIFGNYLVNSVRREVEQREYLATLNWELQDLNKQRENLVHLITHKVKGSFTRTKYIFAEMVDGSFGKLDGMMLKMARRGLESDAEGIHTVDLVLNAFNLGSGAVKYDMKPMELKKVVQEVMSEKGARIKEKGLAITLDAKDAEYPLVGDAFWLKEVMNNFVENALRYSMHGTIQIKLEKKAKSILLSVKDEGVGLLEDDKKGLFTEGGRGKDSLRMNVDSTGYGLFSVKVIVEAHKGRVWAESEGRDKGSTFYAEIPLNQL